MSFTAPLRRSALVLASAAALAAAATPAVADSGDGEPADRLDQEALFGEGDPTYDGVLRQSLALLAQHTAGYTPAEEAVDWLVEQQCDDGSYLSYRADTGEPCQDVTAADSNATAFAVQALSALGGHEGSVADGLRWLRGVQNADGGWSFNPGGASDANSTAVVVGAFAAAGEDPAEVRLEDASPYDALGALQLGCDATEEERGAFAWQPDAESGELFANDVATVDAVLAAQGSGVLVDPEQAADAPAVEPPSCDGDTGETGETDETGETGETTEDPTDGATDGASDEATGEGVDDGAAEEQPVHLQVGAAGARYLAGALDAREQHLVTLAEDGEEQPDYASTAKAVLALVAGGEREAAEGPLDWLQEQHVSWTGYAKSPAALATLVLAAHAGDVSPEDFGGTDLIAQLNALGPGPEEAADGAAADAASDGGGGVSVLLWVGGIALVLGIAVGVVLGRRRRAGRAAE
ncbi:prenyltransferase/squalene oxidase repeat-containing protein [Streptomyces sp. B6B3]|uniref:prenyltransferase/squalene oxidase repeat-containing protein n=1 Tax=Streptomyces sp. B6B3 TaxID=3153570 RepID=UPI00325F7B55